MLLKSLRFFETYKRRHESGFDTPLAISFLVTSRCTLECKHCFYHREKEPENAAGELTLDQYEKLSAGLDDFLIGIFCGGEPFMRSDLADIVTLMQRGNGCLVSGTSTNGQLTSSILHQTEKICVSDPNKLFCLSFSIDGFEDVHDRIRGRGSFDRALRSWKELKQLARHYPNLILALTTVVSTLNQDSVTEFLKWAAAKLGPDEISVMLVRQSPRAGNAIKRVDPVRYLEAQQEVMSLGSRRSLLKIISPHAAFMKAVSDTIHRTMLSGKRGFHCHAGTHGAVINHRGDVNACEVLAADPACGSMGNLKSHDMNFQAIWNGKEALRIRRFVNRCEACAACTHETMGFIPSMLFAPNKPGALFDQWLSRCSRLVSMREESEPAALPILDKAAGAED
ncbi:MAG: radical SAM protein [Pseudomonadota bacterium]